MRCHLLRTRELHMRSCHQGQHRPGLRNRHLLQHTQLLGHLHCLHQALCQRQPLLLLHLLLRQHPHRQQKR